MNRPLSSLFADAIKTMAGWRGLLLLLGSALAWHALRTMPWHEAWGLLAGIGPSAVLLLLALNLLLLPLMTGRWWQLLRTQGLPVSLFSLSLYRCAGNALSYLTPGPHFGGEPLLVFLLHRQQGMPLPAATTSVLLDRLLEVSATILVLGGCLILLTASNSGPFPVSLALPLALALLVVIIALLIALGSGNHPLSRLVSRFKWLDGGWLAKPFPVSEPLTATILQGELLAQSLLQQHRGQFLLANLFSLVHWLGVFAEFWLMAVCLGHPLHWSEVIGLVVAARLAFFTPLPAGLGVLETALPWLTASLGQGSGLGLGLCLIIRFRDLVFSLAGLALAMKYLTCPDRALTIFKDTD